MKSGWNSFVRQGERLYPIWPRSAKNEAANTLLTALDLSWTAENGSREQREWWTATKNWKKSAVAAVRRNLRTTREGPRRSSWGGPPNEVLGLIVGTGEKVQEVESAGNGNGEEERLQLDEPRREKKGERSRRGK